MSHDLGPQKDQNPLEFAIIGGGIGGTILAIGLHKHNIKFKIYESAKEFGEIGAGLNCAPNAVKALSLISPDLFAAYKQHETPNLSPDLAQIYMEIRHGTQDDTSDKPRWHMNDLAFTNMGKVVCPPGILRRSSVHRARFLDEIVKLIPDDVTTFNKALSRIEELPEAEGGRKRMYFTDGSTAEADAVIGCDGIKSVVRMSLYGNAIQPQYTKAWAYRALVPADEMEAAFGHDQAYNGTAYIGQGGYLIHYPVEHGKVINMVAIKWEEGSECNEKEEEEEEWQVYCDIQAARDDFGGWHPEFVRLLTKYGGTVKWGMFDLPHDEAYFQRRVCLLGDSCHASTPHIGAGAGQAMEEAYVLSNLLAKVRDHTNLNKAFKAYDAVRRPRSQRIIACSKESGDGLSMRHSESGDNPAKVAIIQERALNSSWDIDLEQHLNQAIEIMDSL